MNRSFRAVLFAIVAAATAGGALALAAGAPHRGGTVVYAIGADPGTLNPAITTDVSSLSVDCKMFNGLVWLDAKHVPHPELATDWFIVRDGSTYTFKLRHNVKWHDGQPFTSADVKFTFDNVLSKYHPRGKQAFANVRNVTVPDAYTVVVNFSKPYGPFLQNMTCQDGAILPRHLYEGTDVLKNPHNSDKPVGTGPFMFSQWLRGDRIAMVRNPNYFERDQPYLDALTAKIVADPTSRIQGLLTGEIDFVQSFFLPKSQMQVLESKPSLQHRDNTDLPGNYLMFYNTTRGPLQNKLVRQALLRGLDRRQILQQAYFGVGRVGESAIHQQLWAYDPHVHYSNMYPFDSRRANALLDKAGFPRKGGTRFSLHVVYDVSQAGFQATAQIMRDNWSQLGVDASLEPLETQVTANRVFVKQDFDVSLYAYTTAGDPALGIARAYVTTPPGRPYTNPTGYSNPKLDALFLAGESTPRLKDRLPFYSQAQALIAADLPTINLIDRTEVDVANAKLGGLWQSGQPYDEWGRVWRSDSR